MPVYETLPAEELAIDSGHLAAADFVTFASASSVHQMIALLGAGAAKLLAGPRLVSIGPQTSAALAAHGLEAAAEADPHTGDGPRAGHRRPRCQRLTLSVPPPVRGTALSR